ncbi:MAG: YARHG domain-containing protein [Candidatus Azobacteroides sp.]|nr:YARHG domain-containing protein [Candidatus Azobacteroides sp.]
MISTSDLQKWQVATNGINESGQKDLTGEEWSALVTLNESLQNGNLASNESHGALALLKNNLIRHDTNQILQMHLQNFIALCEQYFTNKNEPAKPQIPPPPLKVNLQSQSAIPSSTFGSIPSEDIANWQKAIQSIEAGQSNLSPEEWSAFQTLKEFFSNGYFESNENAGNIRILKNALPRHSVHRLLQIHLKNFIALCEKYFQTPTLTISTPTRSSGTATKTEKTKGGGNKVLIFIIAVLVVGYLIYSHWDAVKGTIGIKPSVTDTIRVGNKANLTTDLETIEQQTMSNSTRQSSNTTDPIISVITPWTRFTNTFVAIESNYRVTGYYIISNADGNLYHRVWDDSNKKYTENQLVLENVKEIYGNGSSFFAIKNDESLWAWGENSDGQLGDNTGINKMTPIKIMDNVRDICVPNSNSKIVGSIFTLKNDGTVYVWGKNQYGQLGVGDTENRYAPVKIPLENVSFIDTEMGWQAYHVVTLSGDEYELSGRLVSKHNYNVNFPAENKLTPNGEFYRNNELLASNVASASVIGSDSYITKNGELYCWGTAPIGDGSNIPRKNPVLVLQNVIQSGENNTNGILSRIALSSAGELYGVDVKNTYKYKVMASNVYLLSFGDGMITTEATMLFYRYSYYYGNDNSFYMFEIDKSGNFKQELLLNDVALPKIKYVIKPPTEQIQTMSQSNRNSTTSSDANNVSSSFSTQLLTENDLQGLSKQDLRILRNEIYARHGYIFKSQDLRDYFSAKDWYHPQYSDVSNLLNTTEKKNVTFIQRHE